MSARVCLFITTTWLMLAAAAAGQAAGPASQGAETEDWRGGAAPPAELISNAPVAVSYAENIAGQAPPTEHERLSPPPAGDRDLGREAMPLPPRSKPRNRQSASPAGVQSGGRALTTVLTSLAVVLAVFFAFVWLTRSAAPKGMTMLSNEVVESLGRAPLMGRQQMQLIRIGNKLVLLSVTATGADTLTEITDPQEVDRLAGLCRQARAGSISDTFRQVLAQASAEPATVSRAEQRPLHRSGARETHRA